MEAGLHLILTIIAFHVRLLGSEPLQESLRRRKL
jgi:hypothetical protein